MVESLRANAAIEPVLVDDHGGPISVGTREHALSPKIVRAVLLRDGHCRVGCCERRDGLPVHHLIPRSTGGTDDVSNLAAACSGGATDHHQMLIPNAPGRSSATQTGPTASGLSAPTVPMPVPGHPQRERGI
jgi:hypothetical protein